MIRTGRLGRTLDPMVGVGLRSNEVWLVLMVQKFTCIREAA